MGPETPLANKRSLHMCLVTDMNVDGFTARAILDTMDLFRWLSTTFIAIGKHMLAEHRRGSAMGVVGVAVEVPFKMEPVRIQLSGTHLPFFVNNRCCSYCYLQ